MKIMGIQTKFKGKNVNHCSESAFSDLSYTLVFPKISFKDFPGSVYENK